MRPIAITWPVASTTSIAQLQTLGGAGSLSLNGSLVNPGINIPPIVFAGITRTITLTSVNNLSGVNFTIHGYFNGGLLTEVLAGPNNNTVSSVNIYDGVYSITTNAAAAAVSAGTGTTGRTRWISFDYNKSFPDFSVQVNVVAATINYTFFTTVDEVATGTPTLTPLSVAMTNATTTQYESFSDPIKWMNVTINSSNATGTLVATFLQQGIAP